MATCAHQVHGAVKRAGHRTQSDLEPGNLAGGGGCGKGCENVLPASATLDWGPGAALSPLR